jgi:hypothetical protein
MAHPEGFPELVFRIEFPIEELTLRYSLKSKVVGSICPTMNAYGSMPKWKRSLVYKALDSRISASLLSGRWPRKSAVKAATHKLSVKKKKVITTVTKGERRAVVVTRHSSRRPDEMSVDVIGGKVPIDRLVQAQVLAGDSRKWLERVAQWEPAKPGEGKLVIEVFAPPLT